MDIPGSSPITMDTLQSDSCLKKTLRSFKKAAAQQNPEGEATADLRGACSEMAALFVNQLFKAMRATVPESGLIEKSSAEKIYEEMLDMHLSQTVTVQDRLGLTSALQHRLLSPSPETEGGRKNEHRNPEEEVKS